MPGEHAAWHGTMPCPPPAVPAMLIAFNKPFNVLCQFTDRSVPPRPTLAGFGLPPRVYAAGRLDHDSEGLLLLTDNGTLAHKLTDPKHKADKLYWVQVEGTPSDGQLQQLRDGVVLNDGPTLPANIRAKPIQRTYISPWCGSSTLVPSLSVSRRQPRQTWRRKITPHHQAEKPNR